ncbi:hypothetical protein ACFV30_39710 [Streptomyces sp. NPDC059752]|uniref:hypothetical protein n=1 Tax=unclassified Streptomyces TaxID=2593676 RepID=UPI003661F853
MRRLMVVAVLDVGQQAAYAVLVVYVERKLGLPGYGYSLMQVAAAVGSLAGASAAAGVRAEPERCGQLPASQTAESKNPELTVRHSTRPSTRLG